MHVAGAVEVGVALVAAMRAKEQFSPFAWHALALPEREPHALAAAARTVLRGAVRVDFDAHHPRCIRFLFRELVDLAFQLVRLFAIEPPRLAAALGPDHPQAFKDEHTARILLTHLHHGSCRLVRGSDILATKMLPELLIAAFSFDWLARLPLLLGHPLQMPVAVLIEPPVRDKARQDDLPVLSGRDHRQVFHIEIDRHCHQVGILLALSDLLRADGFRLQEVYGRSLLREHQGGALLFPARLLPALLARSGCSGWDS